MVTENDSLLIFLVLAPQILSICIFLQMLVIISDTNPHSLIFYINLSTNNDETIVRLQPSMLILRSTTRTIEIENHLYLSLSFSQPNLGFFLIICNCYILSIFANCNCHCAICKFCCAIDGLSVVEDLANCEGLTV